MLTLFPGLLSVPLSRGYFGIWGSAVVAVTVVERSKQESIYGLSSGTKRGGSCKEVAFVERLDCM